MKTLEFIQPKKYDPPLVDSQLSQLTLNDYVKIEVKGKVDGRVKGTEVFWVRILKVGSKEAIGMVGNNLVHSKLFGFDHGDEITFDKDCIIKIVKEADLRGINHSFKL